MTNTINFSLEGWSEYTSWQAEDKRTLKKINELIKDIGRSGHSGIGHPEPLRHELEGYRSRKIDEKNRLVYRILDNGSIEIIHCKRSLPG